MYNKYEGKVRVDVAKKIITVSVKIDYFFKGNSDRILKFYLPTQTSDLKVISDAVKKVSVSKLAKWPDLVDGDTQVTLELNKAYSKGENITIKFDYISDLSGLPDTGMNMFSEDVVEIGIYTPWFPLTELFQEAYYNIEIDIDKGYVVIGGNTQKSKDTWLINQKSPHVCATILASKAFQNNVVSSCHGAVITKVYWVKEKDKKLAQEVHKNVSDIMKFFINTFGPIDSERNDIVIIPRDESDTSGGYCRPGLIVLPGGRGQEEANHKDLFGYLAHELAHLWWSKADMNTWENWLNESFAQYSNLMAHRELKNAAHLNQSIERYKENTKNMESIRSTVMGSKDFFPIWYNKGPAILNDLENRISEEKFKNLCKIIHCERLTKTEDVINKIKKIEGQEVGEYLSVLLDS